MSDVLTAAQVVALRAALPSDEELLLLRRDVEGMLHSFRYPKGTRDADQPTEWHQARTLMAFVKRLERARRAMKRAER